MIKGTEDNHKYKIKPVLYDCEVHYELYEYLPDINTANKMNKELQQGRYVYKLIGRYTSKKLAEEEIKIIEHNKKVVSRLEVSYYL